ncbi:tripartite tricarboxylate transporter substrate binding protein [Roseomonas terrae]|uniref:Tripartite tricarboxylate transporter substrate binding protein n=1 Tax=Neoroseomonas terrae TaxID=424799 RepID=A0ABS5EQ93_9PROT|nr:tripartite tricarboxylate transporter substrate binding protein [Neoroseomonas terrae]MBR0653184.1 tripartite tricarboxylate transporter substrate binding protein [Neoroseomonas terrae]
MNAQHLPRRRIIAAAAASLLPGAALGQAGGAYPNRPVRIMQGYTAGGPTDLIARVLADKLSIGWGGRPVVVEARPGASGTLAAGAVARSAPDGYTLVLLASTHVQTPTLLPRLPFHTVNDFTPLAQIASYPLLLVVNADFAARTLVEFVGRAREQPGGVTFATAGIGSSPHLSAAQLAVRAGVEFTYVQYPGTSNGQTAVMTGEVNAMFLNPLLALPMIRDGRFRVLGTTGAERWRDLPDVPTIAEAGFNGYEANVWYGVLGPAGLPPELVTEISSAIRGAMQQPDLQERLRVAGFNSFFVGPTAFRATMENDLTRWAEIIRRAGIRGAD